MSIRNLSFLLALIGSMSFSTAIFAGGSPLETMAGIMMHLDHYPSNSEKTTLDGIAKSSSANANQKALAIAMKNLQHKVMSGDVPKLKAILNDSSASTGEKDLASIILSLNHSPSGSDKEKLKKIMH